MTKTAFESRAIVRRHHACDRSMRRVTDWCRSGNIVSTTADLLRNAMSTYDDFARRVAAIDINRGQ
ncbi:hypothetical protein WK25_15955 [Burkholderia latens]|nr:hypothetical protein WK25_15955 [Burkholderia latens]